MLRTFAKVKHTVMKNCTIAALSVFMLSVSSAGGFVQAHSVTSSCKQKILITGNACCLKGAAAQPALTEEVAELPHTQWASKMMIW
jgi:hypothetical protein